MVKTSYRAHCKWFPFCKGGCQRDREPQNIEELPGNRFCEATKNFLEYAYPRLAKLRSKIVPN